MRIFFLTLVAVAVAAAGFLLGRFTAPADVAAPVAMVSDTSEAASGEFPVPPETLPYLPGGTTTETTDDAALVLETPSMDESVIGPFEVSGRAASGSELLVTLVAADGSDADPVWSGTVGVTSRSGESFGRFSVTVEPPPEAAGRYLVRVGSAALAETVTDLSAVTRAVVVGIPEAVTVKVFFSRLGFDGGLDCTLVQPVERVVSSRDSVYRATVEQLLAGPTEAESAAGYSTSLPKGAVLRSVAADAKGTVIADFSAALGQGVAGSCLVGAIRAQITETLRQFPEVRDVVVAVDGRFEDVLQP
jgi:hypothetical protein